MKNNRSDRLNHGQQTLESIDIAIDEAFQNLKESKLSKRRHKLFSMLDKLYGEFTVNPSSTLKAKDLFGLRGVPKYYRTYEKYVIRLNTYIYRIREEYLCDYYSENESEIRFTVDSQMEYVSEYKKNCPVCRLKVTYKGRDYLDILRETQCLYQKEEKRQESVFEGQYYFLTSAASVLKIRPAPEEAASPIYFRKTGPIAADIDGGTVYTRPQVSEIVKALKQQNIVVLCGDAASGKTVISRIVAYQWLKTGNVRFVQLKTMSIKPYELSREIERYGREEPEPLLVIEDAHVKMIDINEVLSARSEDWPRILFTTRKVETMLHSQENNNFKSLYEITLDDNSPQTDIIKMYLESKGWPFTPELRDDVLEISGQNLWLQAYALQSLDDSNGRYVSTELLLKEVKRDLEDLRCVKIDLGDEIKYLLPRLLVTLSILYRYEIPTDIGFINHIFPYTNAEIKVALDELVAMGEASVIERKGHSLYGLTHSALADLYFHFVNDPCWNEEPIYGDEFQFLCQYIESEKAINGLELLLPSGPILYYPNLPKQLDRQKLAYKVNEFTDLVDILLCLWSISLEDDEGYKALMKNIDKDNLARKISEANDFWLVEHWLHLLVIEDINACTKILKRLDVKKHAVKANESGGPIHIIRFMKSLSEIDSRMAEKAWRHIDKEKLAFSLYHLMDLTDVRWCIGILLRAYPEAARVMVSHIHSEQFARRISNEDVFNVALECVESIFKADTEKGNEVWGHVDHRKLTRRIPVDDIDGVLLSIASICELNPRAGRDLFKHVDIESFALLALSQEWSSWGDVFKYSDIEHLPLIRYEVADTIRVEGRLHTLFAIDFDTGKEVVREIRKLNPSPDLLHTLDNLENSWSQKCRNVMK